jgi:hypothetical protein
VTAMPMIPLRSLVRVPVGIVVVGIPRTKKTHNKIGWIGKACPACKKGKFLKVFPSSEWTRWVRDAEVVGHLPGQVGFPWPREGMTLPDQPYNVAAKFYRDRAVGDAMGFYQGLADLLAERGVISNDRWLVQWDGSRLLKDAAHPRVELVLTSAESVLDPA